MRTELKKLPLVLRGLRGSRLEARQQERPVHQSFPAQSSASNMRS